VQIFINNTSVDKYILTLRDLCLRCEPQANNVKKIDEGLRYLSIRVLFNIFPIGNSVDMFICIVERSSCREWMSLRFRKKYRIKLPKYGRNCCLWSQQRSTSGVGPVFNFKNCEVHFHGYNQWYECERALSLL
jgi:hypothetical protein